MYSRQAMPHSSEPHVECDEVRSNLHMNGLVRKIVCAELLPLI
jgi:hypothetical protein